MSQLTFEQRNARVECDSISFKHLHPTTQARLRPLICPTPSPTIIPADIRKESTESALVTKESEVETAMIINVPEQDAETIKPSTTMLSSNLPPALAATPSPTQDIHQLYKVRGKQANILTMNDIIDVIAANLSSINLVCPALPPSSSTQVSIVKQAILVVDPKDMPTQSNIKTLANLPKAELNYLTLLGLKTQIDNLPLKSNYPVITYSWSVQQASYQYCNLDDFPNQEAFVPTIVTPPHIVYPVAIYTWQAQEASYQYCNLDRSSGNHEVTFPVELDSAVVKIQDEASSFEESEDSRLFTSLNDESESNRLTPVSEHATPDPATKNKKAENENRYWYLLEGAIFMLAGIGLIISLKNKQPAVTLDNTGTQFSNTLTIRLPGPNDLHVPPPVVGPAAGVLPGGGGSNFAVATLGALTHAGEGSVASPPRTPTDQIIKTKVNAPMTRGTFRRTGEGDGSETPPAPAIAPVIGAIHISGPTGTNHAPTTTASLASRQLATTHAGGGSAAMPPSTPTGQSTKINLPMTAGTAGTERSDGSETPPAPAPAVASVIGLVPVPDSTGTNPHTSSVVAASVAHLPPSPVRPADLTEHDTPALGGGAGGADRAPVVLDGGVVIGGGGGRGGGDEGYVRRMAKERESHKHATSTLEASRVVRDEYEEVLASMDATVSGKGANHTDGDG